MAVPDVKRSAPEHISVMGVLPFSRINLQGQIIDCNDEYFAMCGYSRDEVMGKNQQLIFDKSMPSALLDEGYKQLRSGRPFCAPIRGRSKDGQTFWCEAYFMPLVKAGNIFAFGALYHPLDPVVQRRAEKVYNNLSPSGTGSSLPSISALFSYLPLIVLGLSTGLAMSVKALDPTPAKPPRARPRKPQTSVRVRDDRTPGLLSTGGGEALSNAEGSGLVQAGLALPQAAVPRDDLAAVIASLVDRPEVRQVIMEIAPGEQLARDAVRSMVRHSTRVTGRYGSSLVDWERLNGFSAETYH